MLKLFFSLAYPFSLCLFLVWCFHFCNDRQFWCEQMWRLLVIVQIV